MKCIIAGGRTFNDYELLESVMNDLKSKSINITTIISGCAPGADSLAIKYAEENNIELMKFPANWRKFGRSAGFKRNAEMGNHADMLIAFWNKKSRGTKHMIGIGIEKELLIKVVNYE